MEKNTITNIDLEPPIISKKSSDKLDNILDNESKKSTDKMDNILDNESKKSSDKMDNVLDNESKKSSDKTDNILDNESKKSSDKMDNILDNESKKSSDKMDNVLDNESKKSSDKTDNILDNESKNNLDNVIINKSHDVNKSYNVNKSHDINIPFGKNLDNIDGVPVFGPVDNDKIQSFKTVKRRGNTYMLRESMPSEESDDLDVNNNMMVDLYTESLRMSSAATKKSNWLKYLFIFCSIFITISGTVIGVLSLDTSNNRDVLTDPNNITSVNNISYTTTSQQYVSSILGFIITAIQTLLSTFAIEKRSVLLRDAGNKLRKISRDVKVLQYSELRSKDKMKRLDELYTEVDELDLNMFDNSITTRTLEKATNIVSSKKSKSSSLSDLYENQRLKVSDDNDRIILNNVTKPNTGGDVIIDMMKS